VDKASLPSIVQSVVAGDFAGLAERFAQAGCRVAIPARGILHVAPADDVSRPRLLLSVGIHGDETAPIEMLAHLLEALAGERLALSVELMAVVGNLDAIASGKRFLETDMNRLFTGATDVKRPSAEARRTAEIMRAVTGFFVNGEKDSGEKWHFDLHAAIRPSYYPAFAVIPDVIDFAHKQVLLRCLGAAGVQAAILNRHLAGTFSAWTARTFGAAAATLELGQVSALGDNDLSRFDAVRKALDAYMRTGEMPIAAEEPLRFRVVQELVKHSAAFRMTLERKAWNFTSMEPGALIAEDGDHVYRVGPHTEYVVFPNPDVHVGLRAGLMLVRDGETD
jgi:succinylglutamate desuccinylase